MKIRKVINEEMVKGQHHVLVKYIYNDKLSHYEYYVGVPEKHKAYENFSTIENKRWWVDPLWDSNLYKNIKKALAYNNAWLLKKAIYKLKSPFNIENKDFELPEALKHAWLSFVGNNYRFLKINYCYYGGGMYIPNFDEKDCKISAEIAMKLLGQCLLKIDDVLREPIKVKFEE